MAKNTLLQVRIDDSLKNAADALFSDLGLDTPTAIRMFLKQSVKKQGLPFEVVQPTPNAETIAAMEEADSIGRDPHVKKYISFSDLLAEVQNEV